MEYSWIPDCQNNCASAGQTDCPNLKIDCMCKDEPYVLAGLCCVSEQCGAYGLLLAKEYVESYCQEWKVKGPDLDNLTCATVTSQTTTASSTATSSATDKTSSTATSTATSESSESGVNGLNTPLIGGIVGGIVAILLIVGVLVFWWWKRKASKPRPTKPSGPPFPSHGDKAELEMVQLSELPPQQLPTGPYGYGSHQGSQFASNTSLHSSTTYPVPAYSPLGYNSSHAELGTSGARPHGSELGGRPLLPPRPELEGMSFATHHPNMRTELPA